LGFGWVPMYTFCVLRGVLRFFDNTILLTYQKKKLKCVQFRILGWFWPKLVMIDFCFTQNDVFQQYDEEMKGQKLLDS
jgi:hypothetical protein